MWQHNFRKLDPSGAKRTLRVAIICAENDLNRRLFDYDPLVTCDLEPFANFKARPKIVGPCRNNRGNVAPLSASKIIIITKAAIPTGAVEYLLAMENLN